MSRGYLQGHPVFCLMSNPEFNIPVSHSLATVQKLGYTVGFLGSNWHFTTVLDLVACDKHTKKQEGNCHWTVCLEPSSRLWPYKSRSYT